MRDDLPGLDRNRIAEHRSGVNERMKLSVLAARICRGGELGKQLSVELTTSKLWVNLFGIDAGEFGANASGNYLASQKAGGNSPHWKQGFKSGSAQLLFAIGTNICQEQISERDAFNSALHRALASCLHCRFILFVGTRPRQFDFPKRKLCGCG